MKYYSKTQLIEKAKEKIVVLDNQKEALDNIATLLSMHMRRLTALDNGIDDDYLPYNSMLIIAPTGSGKSYIISKLCEIAGLPFSMISASHLTAEGYKGLNFSQAIYSCQNSCVDKNSFLDGIVFIDEFDKCKFTQNTDGCPQFDFLTPIEGKGVSVDTGSGKFEVIPTNRMLFIFAGAFDGLDSEILKRTNKNNIGFSASNTTEKVDDILTKVTLTDIENYGFSPELLGRIGLLQYIPPLKKTDYKSLLKGEGCTYEKKFTSLFNVSGVEFSITDTACELIADFACKSNSGARFLSSFLQKELSKSFSVIDDNSAISKVELNTFNQDFTINYIETEKKLLADYTINTPEKAEPIQDYSIAHLITTEESLNNLCSELLKFADINKKEDELLMFYFLQISLRFMHIGLISDEQVVSSLCEIATLTDRDKGDYTGFDILVSELLEKHFQDKHTSNCLTIKQFHKSYKEIENIYSNSKIVKYCDNIRKNFYI